MARPKRCKTCKKARKQLNRKGKCIGCSMNKLIAVNKQLRARKGKHYNKWKRNLLESLKRRS